MDEVSQAKFDAILAKDISALSESDKSFLRARKTYIPNKKQQELKEILRSTDPVATPTPDVSRSEWSEHPADTVEQDDEDDDAEG